MSAAATHPPINAGRKATRGRRERLLLELRLSDGRSWAHEFGASSADELRDGAFEAWVACRVEWQRRVETFPARQSRKRAAMLATMPDALQLHVRDTNALDRAWLNANYGADPMRCIVICCPGTATNGELWSAADWHETWGRCLRSWWAAAELARFLRTWQQYLELTERIGAALRRVSGGAEGNAQDLAQHVPPRKRGEL